MKLTNEEVLAKIKVLIQKYFEDVGRELIEDTHNARIFLINEIENFLEATDIPSKNLVMESLDLDEKARSEGENFWTPF